MFPKKLERKIIYESSWIRLYTDRVLMPSGKIIEKYHFLDYPNQGVVVLLTNSKKEICFIKALRYVTQRIEWELPSGGIEKGEDILAAAKREALEETGYQAETLKHIYTYYPSSGMSNQKAHVVFGEVHDIKQSAFDTDEVQEVRWFSLESTKKMIESEEITDGFSLMALLFYFYERQRTLEN